MSTVAMRPPRSLSRMSTGSKAWEGSRASDEDSKTSVKVAVRVRPPLQPTDPGFELIPQRFQRSMVQVTSPTNLVVDSPQGRKLFVFDRVFAEDITQAGVWEYLNESVNAFVQGYNVSLLAYGQSGAGKSYTMGTSGPNEQNDPRQMGVIPRAASVLFEKLAGTPGHRHSGSTGLRTPTRYSVSSASTLGKPDTERTWQLKATYVEIYNEQLRDLLLPESTPPSDRSVVTIREDPHGRIIPTGLHQVNINSVEDLLAALNFGSSIRQTDATAINAKSSRSHAVFSLNLVQRRPKQTPVHEKRFSVPIEAMTGAQDLVTVDSKFHFVDLAGSERLKNTGAQGERAKEGISINAGLASLGKVISQLSSRQAGSHVSYRDSKLTRLLQDSLGGNAITYMIACVTPAEFHLSETLNTVQYAQRARAIQSKPRIQQVNDDADKQALIDRLRAEVTFLREQIRSAERSERRSNVPQERAERHNEREMELQNQLLDVQENYTALSQRHAKLIAEITKTRDPTPDAQDTPTLDDVIGENAVERLKRSNSFAEAVEQVVLEYEKTIQSLESSLSSTRSSLATSESTLLEKETKMAYVETVNSQLQTRLQKLMDRETSNENYLHDLEAKLSGHTNGEEKQNAIIEELRKELSRVRENEAGCEDYISTLEERLAEADHDVESLQREVESLQSVVERQRSIGKLDSLLYELDRFKKSDDVESKDGEAHVNGKPLSEIEDRQVETRDLAKISESGEVPVNGEGEHPPPLDDVSSSAENENGADTLEVNQPSSDEYPPQSPAQTKYMADKLENVTQELFDLRMEHESTVNEFDLLSAKYEETLRILAELQSSFDESGYPAAARKTSESVASPASTRPQSFLEDGRVKELRNGEQLPQSQSLSLELHSAGLSQSGGDVGDSSELARSDTTVRTPEPSEPNGVKISEEMLMEEMEKLKSMTEEREEGLQALTQQYEELKYQHMETLDYVEELKAEVKKAQMTTPTSPTAPVIRRKSSQNVLAIDRAHRSFAALRNIASDNFEEDPDTMQNFEINLNAAMHELHVRSERIQSLEAELGSAKKEMESKTAIISGLARERSSIKAGTNVDMSMVSALREQLMQSENQIRMLHEAHTAEKKDLEDQVKALNEAIAESNQTAAAAEKDLNVSEGAMPGVYPETPLNDLDAPKELGQEVTAPSATEQKLAQVQEELAQWESKHNAAMESMKISEQKLLDTIIEMEAAMKTLEADRAVVSDKEAPAVDESVTAARVEQAREEVKGHYEGLLSSLRQETDETKANLAVHVSRIAELEQAHSTARLELEEYAQSKEIAETAMKSHEELKSQLEQQIAEHQTALQAHEDGLKTLQEAHEKHVEDAKNSTLAAAQAESEARIAEMSSKHFETINALQEEVTKARADLTGLMQSVTPFFETTTTMENLKDHIASLAQQRDDLQAQQQIAQEESNATKDKIARLEATVAELSTLNEDTLRELEQLGEKHKSTDDEKKRLTEQYQKSSRIVEELEEQLANNFDQHQAANNRLSTLQSERNVQLEEANAARAVLEKEVESLQARIALLEGDVSGRKPTDAQRESRHRSDSVNSTFRKGSGALPSPPPAIPLPPLPGNLPAVPSSAATVNGQFPMPPSSSASVAPAATRDSYTQQQVEEAEARIRTIEKHLMAEKQLTATLEEALTDLETQGRETKAELEKWKKQAWSLDDELKAAKKQRESSRYSMQAVEDERKQRIEAEAAKRQLEEKMMALNKKKKKSSLACF